MRLPPKDGAWALSWRIVVMLMASSPLVHAYPQTRDEPKSGTMRFDLPAQPLETALAAYGRLTGHSVLVTSELTAHRQAAAVHDDLPPREALQRLLVGTQLEARYTNSTAFTLVPARVDSRSNTEPLSGSEPASNRLVGSDYAAVIQTTITRVLCDAQPETFGRFRVGIQLWIEDSGRVSAARVLETSGLPERDAQVLEQMRNMVLDAPPPAGMAQPVTILLTPRPDPTLDCQN